MSWCLLSIALLLTLACQREQRAESLTDRAVEAKRVPPPTRDSAEAEAAVGTHAVRDDGPPDGPALSAAECKALSLAIEARYEEAAGCERDGDCIYVEPDCPFGCVAAVNRHASLADVQQLRFRFASRCMYCTQSCLPVPAPPICRDGRCAMGSKGAMGRDRPASNAPRSGRSADADRAIPASRPKPEAAADDKTDAKAAVRHGVVDQAE